MASPAVPKDTNMPRLHCLYMAKLANQAERYNDMAKFMSEIITNHSANLTLEERTLFSGAYKKLVDSLRQACRIASFNKHEELGRVEEDRARMARLYGSLVGSQLAEVCAGVLDLLDKRLIPAVEVSEESEGKVYYMKMKGDFYRYLAEVKTGEERSMVVEKALHAYKAAEDIALAELAPTHPTRLGLAANFSLFYFEVLNLPDLACSMAKEAYKDAMAEIDNEDSYNQSTDLIMQLIRDNFNLWNSIR